MVRNYIAAIWKKGAANGKKLHGRMEVCAPGRKLSNSMNKMCAHACIRRRDSGLYQTRQTPHDKWSQGLAHPVNR